MRESKFRALLVLVFVLPLGIPVLQATAQEGETPAREKRERLQHHAAAGLAALNVYSTFGCLGLTAELYEAKKFDAAKVDQVTDDVVKTCDLAVELLKNARTQEGKSGQEVPYEELIKCYYLLDREARLLNEAAESGDKAKLQQFHQAREESWQMVQDVLGIDDEDALQEKRP